MPYNAVRLLKSRRRQDRVGTPHRVQLGGDYAFATTLTGEVYDGGTGISNPARYEIAGLPSGQRQAAGRPALRRFVRARRIHTIAEAGELGAAQPA